MKELQEQVKALREQVKALQEQVKELTEENEKLRSAYTEKNSNYNLLVQKIKTERKAHDRQVKEFEEIIINQDKVIQSVTKKESK